MNENPTPEIAEIEQSAHDQAVAQAAEKYTEENIHVLRDAAHIRQTPTGRKRD